MKIRWTIKANQDLRQVENYIARNNPTAAIQMVFRIIDSVENLIAHPEIGRPGRVHGTRELVINSTPYIVPYRIKQNHIEIISVLHSAMKWPDGFNIISNLPTSTIMA